jgi:hypothetical protein
VHANITAVVKVQTFTVRPVGGTNLEVRQLTHDVDVVTPKSAAAIVPIAPLRAGTTYDVSFVGTVDGVPVSRNWAFTTR